MSLDTQPESPVLRLFTLLLSHHDEDWKLHLDLMSKSRECWLSIITAAYILISMHADRA